MPRKPANSKAGLLMGAGSSAIAVMRAVKQVRRAGGTRGGPAAAHTATGLLPLATSAVFALRRLRGHSRRHSH
ncbi:hypothetical protein [Streptomyces sp. NPDC014623]|uniref:hypothetical protein n=1 Tax=Streptomyces sp. NPDC014623 TaxID=3364875 RepID=UPI0036F813E7